jgi:hypothetical protein
MPVIQNPFQSSVCPAADKNQIRPLAMARLIREAAPLSSGHGRAESPRLHRTVAAANLEPVDGIAFADLAEQNVMLKSMVSRR